MSKSLLDGLNALQKSAVTQKDGPVMVVASAGNGKTRVISHRIAHLASTCPPSELACVSLTERGAEDIRKRAQSISGKDLKSAWFGTANALALRILRKEIEPIGFTPSFTLLDEDDSQSLIKHILREFKIYEALYKGVASRISSLKQSCIEPEEFLTKGDVFGFEDKLARVYLRYRDDLRKYNCLDIDDLAPMAARLCSSNPKTLAKYQKTIRHILVDDFHDAPVSHYRLLKLLSGGEKGSFFVSCVDCGCAKSLKAEAESSFKCFSKDFPKAKVFNLDQNFRSSKNIIDVSDSIMNAAKDSKARPSSSESPCGEKVSECWFPTEVDEALYIAKCIKGLYQKGINNYADFGVFYRIGTQARPLEDALRRERIPYRVVGNAGFYQRPEVKDMLAYASLALNPDNSVSLRRIINTPPRGIGASTITKLELAAKKKSISLFAAMKDMLKGGSTVTAPIKEKLESFVGLIESASPKQSKTASDLINRLFTASGYNEFIDDTKAESIIELVNLAGNAGADEFLDRAALSDPSDEEHLDGGVSLMTLHAAKGREFPVVFISGLEEGVIPYLKAREEFEIVEERKLLYTGMTRAKTLLWLTGAKKRRLYTKIQEQTPSRFLKDIPTECCNKIDKIAQIVQQSSRKPEKPKIFKPLSSYSVGTRVKHPKWGVGVVRDNTGEGEEQKIVVNFPDVGLKMLALKFAHLERI